MATKAVVEVQKKRALDALERRFAVAKAEVHHQGRNKRRREDSSLKSGPVSLVKVKASPAFVQNTALKKDLEAEGLTYSGICQPVHENLLNSVEVTNKDKPTVDKFLHELRQKGDAGQKYLQGSKCPKFDNWILLDKCVQGKNTSAARLRALQANSKRSKKRMSMKQIKKCGLLDLPQKQQKEENMMIWVDDVRNTESLGDLQAFKRLGLSQIQLRFELFMPVHEMWKTYVMQLLKNIGKSQVAQSLLVADLHGAILRVIDCKVDSFIGVVGIMIRETPETFGIITQENKFRVVPKRNTIFIFQADCWRITLHGDKCISRKLDLS